MIFIASNEDGIPTWKLVQEGIKVVTRRVKPLSVGKEFAIQPGRGKFAICRAKVVSCMKSLDHYDSFAHKLGLEKYKVLEAHKEGFVSWDGLMRFFQKKNIQFIDTFRIEYVLIEDTNISNRK